MKQIIVIYLLLFTYSCKTKKTVETPASKLWQSGIDTITLPVNDTITVPPYGSELTFDSGWITVGPKINSLKSGVLKRHKKPTEQWIEIDENDTGVNTISNAALDTPYNIAGLSWGISRELVDADLVRARRLIEGITGGHGDTTSIVLGGKPIIVDSSKLYLGSLGYYKKEEEVWDTLKVIVSYVDTSIEARPNVIDWRYLYYVKKRNKLFNSDNYYLELDKNRIKTSIVILEARILNPKP